MSNLEIISNRSNALLRKQLLRHFSSYLGYYVITEYPKSGGTWLGLMLSDALGVPFPRNALPMFRSSVMHGHYLPSTIRGKAVVLWRDGRDVMVSWYYHCLFYNEHKNAALVDKVRGTLSFRDINDIHANLPTFIEYSFLTQQHPRFSWSEFVDKWLVEEKAISVRYEDLRKDAEKELSRIISYFDEGLLEQSRLESIVDKYSFSRMSNRQPGTERKGSFLRKGVVGDWKNQFSEEARVAFDKYAGEQLIKLGYEQDHSWVGI